MPKVASTLRVEYTRDEIFEILLAHTLQTVEIGCSVEQKNVQISAQCSVDVRTEFADLESVILSIPRAPEVLP